VNKIHIENMLGFMKNRHILQDWADAKKILSVYEKSNEDIAPSVRCTICQVSVSRNRILQRADVPVCANCWELGDEVVMIIQEYSVSLSMRRWAALAFNKPLRLVEAGLQMHPQVSCVEYIEFTRVPIVRCKIQIGYHVTATDILPLHCVFTMLILHSLY